MADPLLTLMTFPQRWDPAGLLELRIATMPFTDPLSPLEAGEPAFADTDLAMDVRVITSLSHLPKSADAGPPVSLALQPRPNRRALLKQVEARFRIAKNPPSPEPPAGSVRVRKYLPASYRQAFAFHGPQHSLVSTDQAYRCAFESAQPPPVFPPPPAEDRVTWGEILGHLLRNPVLAEESGMVFRFDLPLTNEFSEGGWLYAELRPGSPFAALAGVRRYAARIPPLADVRRPVFAAIQFPMDVAAANDDARVFMESETYSDGFAKIPHGAQPVGIGAVDTEPGGPPPSRDRGIRLGWDDEQIATWLNRQIGLDPYTGAAPQLKAPLAVLGYRVDVRESGAVDWTSLMCVGGDVTLDAVGAPRNLDALDLGRFAGELSVETVPLNLSGAALGDFWLPSHYVAWTGGSLVLSDPDLLAINGHDDLLAEQRFSALDADAVPLRYGHDYEFRVRLMDLASGGPVSDEVTDPASSPPFAPVRFRRYVPPRAPIVQRNDGLAETEPPARLEIRRPPLGYPDILFASGPGSIAGLLAERDRLLALPDTARNADVTLPDPDVTSVRITVAVRQLNLDDAEYQELYSVTRDLLVDPDLPSSLDIDYIEVHDVSTITAPGSGQPLRIPTAREVRVSFQSVGKPDATLQYFGNPQVRFSVSSAVLNLRAPSRDERALFAPQPDTDRIHGIYLQPDPALTGFVKQMRAAQGILQPPALDPPLRLARDLDLNCNQLTFSARAGRRTLFGAGQGIRHALAPDRASITFSSQSDLVRHWIVAIRLKLDRDWTWDGLAEQGIGIYREGNLVGTMDLPRVVNRNALTHPDRAHTELVFFDAIDPKPLPGAFPAELHPVYEVRPHFRTPPGNPPDVLTMSLRLPVTTPPVQTPKLVSAGLAFTPFSHDERYASTIQRRRALWLEFDGPPADSNDRYYCRVLATSPDPMLISLAKPLDEPPEPELPIDPELIRVIVPGQSADDSGHEAMQELIKSPSPVHVLVPLPRNADESSLDLFGFFTYELRVGHDATRWCTAQGCFGPPLRVTGVQHPAPPLTCQVSRQADRIEVNAPFATPVLDCRMIRPLIPRSEIWILLYAQVLQVDGLSWRNVLLLQRRARQIRGDANPDFPRPQSALELAVGTFSQDELGATLRLLGLSQSSSLSALAVELIPEIILTEEDQPPRRDPLRESLGDVRILRTSPLVSVPPQC